MRVEKNSTGNSINAWLTLLGMFCVPWILAWLSLYQFNNMWLSFFFYHWLFLCPIAFWRRNLWISSLKKVSIKVSGLLLVLSLVACFIAFYVLDRSGTSIVNSDNTYAMLVKLRFSPDLVLPLGIYFVVVNASLEELFWRGTIQNMMLKLSGENSGFAISICSIAFGAWHYLALRLLLNPGYAEAFTFGIVLSGATLGWLYDKYQTLSVPIVVHAIVLDLPIIVVLWNIIHQVNG